MPCTHVQLGTPKRLRCLVGWLLDAAAAAGLLAFLLACITVPRTRFADVHPRVQIGEVLFTRRFVLSLRK